MGLWKDALAIGFVGIHKSAGSHFTLKKPAVLQVRPSGEAPLNTEEEKAAKQKCSALQIGAGD